jgi:MFS family permease
VTATLPAPTTVDVARVQRRTLTLLSGTQIIGGIGVATGISVGALLGADMAGPTVSGLGGSCAVIGAALVAIPATRIMRSHGRRPGLAFAYLVGLVGAALVIVAAIAHSVPLFLLGTLFFGGSSAANLQARYTAIDLAEPDRRARQLSLVVWVTTVGVVLGPNIAPLANNIGVDRHLPEYTGPYVLSIFAFGLAALLITLLLRPDPLLLARTREKTEPTAARGMWREAARTVAASPGARLGITSVAIGHVVMVGVMSMTPLYIGGYVHEHGDQLRIVGFVLSLHVTGMYALSPVVGWLADKFGSRRVIFGGIGVLLGACALAGTAGESTWRLAIGMGTLGAGWSALMVAGSTLLSASVPLDRRPSVQGLSDVVMGVAGASAGALAGVIVDFFGYPTLALLAAIATAPLLALVLRRLPVPAGAGGAGAGGTLTECD